MLDIRGWGGESVDPDGLEGEVGVRLFVRSRKTASAIGERQILPRHTKRTENLGGEGLAEPAIDVSRSADRVERA